MRTVLTPFRADAFSLACPPKHAFTHESAGNFRSACLCFPQWQRRRPGIQDRACTLAFGASEGPALSLAFSGRTCLGTPALLGIARGRLQSRRSPWVSLWDPRTPCGFVRWREASPHAPSRTRFATGMPYHDKPYFVYANRAFASRSGGFARGARTVEDAVLHGLGLLVDAEDGARGDVGVHVGRAVERVEHRHVPAAGAAAAASAGVEAPAGSSRAAGYGRFSARIFRFFPYPLSQPCSSSGTGKAVRERGRGGDREGGQRTWSRCRRGPSGTCPRHPAPCGGGSVVLEKRKMCTSACICHSTGRMHCGSELDFTNGFSIEGEGRKCL